MLETSVTAARIGTDGWIVSASGDLDLHAAPLLQAELDRAWEGHPSGIVVDLASATFVDSTVLGVLLAARSRLARSGASLVLVSDDRRIVRLLEIAGVDRLFRIEADLRAAVRAALVSPANAT